MTTIYNASFHYANRAPGPKKQTEVVFSGEQGDFVVLEFPSPSEARGAMHNALVELDNQFPNE